MSPVVALQQRRKDDQDRRERTAVLQAGASMVLLARGGARTPVRVQLSSDGAMLTWQAHAAGGDSGVMALAMIREVKPVQQGGLTAWISTAAPVPLQWQVVADDE